MTAIQNGQFEQGEMNRTLDAIRRVLKYMQSQDTALNKELTEGAKSANEVVDSEINLQQKVELTIPLLPLFLNYKAELGIASVAELEDLKTEIKEILLSLFKKSSKDNDS